MNFGVRLKEIRLKQGLTQQQLADILNIPRATIAGYETKGYEPNFETLSKISDIFNISTDYLLGRVDNPYLIKLEGEQLPKEIKDLGVEYLNVAKDLKNKEITPDEINAIIEIVMSYKNKKEE